MKIPVLYALTDREHATVLASLALAQHRDSDLASNYAEFFHDQTPLDDDEIAALAERLNCAPGGEPPPPQTIYVTVEGGCVSSVDRVPADCQVVVIDLDMEGADAEKISPSPLDPETECVLSVW